MSRSRPHRDLKKLQKIWYDKLAEEGFNDIEDTSTERRPLKNWDVNFFRNQGYEAIITKHTTTLDYFKHAEALLEKYQFKNDGHRLVWELHCKGFKEREIAELVGIYKKSMVHHIIAPISRLIKKE